MEIIINKDLKLASLSLIHADAVFEIVDSQRDYLGVWLPFVAFTKQVEDTKSWIKSILNMPTEKKMYNFAILNNQKLVGLIGLNASDIRLNKTEIGYWISNEEQGKGLATLATKALCDFAFIDLNFNKIIIKCGVENLASQKIPQKLGFKMDGIERDGEIVNGKYYDCMVFTRLKREIFN